MKKNMQKMCFKELNGIDDATENLFCQNGI